MACRQEGLAKEEFPDPIYTIKRHNLPIQERRRDSDGQRWAPVHLQAVTAVTASHGCTGRQRGVLKPISSDVGTLLLLHSAVWLYCCRQCQERQKRVMVSRREMADQYLHGVDTNSDVPLAILVILNMVSERVSCCTTFTKAAESRVSSHTLFLCNLQI